MTFIETIPEAEAPDAVRELYDADRHRLGHVANYTRAFSQRPDVYKAWQQLNGAVRASMDLRRYELVTVAAAVRLKSSYCALAHGAILAERLDEAPLARALADTDATLDPLDAALVAFARKVVDDASRITQADVDELRAHGLSDAEVTDVVLAVAIRCFFSKTLDALGAHADPVYRDLEPALRDALEVGRPIG